MIHIAIPEALNEKAVEAMEQVSDEQYRRKEEDVTQLRICAA
jgi:hypothetical protein